MATELDRLRDALGDHDGLLKEYRDRLRVEQEHRLSVQAELERVKTARPWARPDGEPAGDHDAQIETLGREIDALTQRTEAIKAAAAAEVEDANARAVDLEARLADTETRAKDAERSQGKLRREASDAGKAGARPKISCASSRRNAASSSPGSRQPIARSSWHAPMRRPCVRRLWNCRRR